MAEADGDILRAERSGGLSGSVAAPGDKSISHRAMMLGAMAEGETVVTGLLTGDDVLRTGAAMRALGADIERDGETWRVVGAPWRAPEAALYFGNAGTGCRLAMGAVAGRRVSARFDGDASLRARPMGRILDPLRLMGADCSSAQGRLPVAISGGSLSAIDYALPKPSAQIKSAILLAGLGASGETVVREPEVCRDHTERMLKAFGAKIAVEKTEEGRRTRLLGGGALKATNVAVPGDPSSAAFLVAAALLVEGSDITIRNVLMNPQRTGFFETVREMGGDLVIENEREAGGEPVADLRARASSLKGVAVPASRAPSMIDEYPILSVLAAFAAGDSYMPGISELRVKESDRIAAMEAGLKASGADAESGGDWLRVFGRAGDVKGGARIAACHDHRMAMSFLVLGLAAAEPVETDGAGMIATSFPGFAATMEGLGARVG